MNNPYDLHTWSKHYREEAHQEAQRRHLLERARAGREQHSGRGRAGLAWGSVLSLLRSVQLPE
jgi:biotin-(acetyl-CoA carboxylase) ligase